MRGSDHCGGARASALAFKNLRNAKIRKLRTGYGSTSTSLSTTVKEDDICRLHVAVKDFGSQRVQMRKACRDVAAICNHFQFRQAWAMPHLALRIPVSSYSTAQISERRKFEQQLQHRLGGAKGITSRKQPEVKAPEYAVVLAAQPLQ
mmetsp:Transcript_155296/g.275462  ORF Transcript_155296/g.275462 Transcript_155296/m.275462 type:complete len:148 (+) Transcript_155296:1502-1945(+)